MLSLLWAAAIGAAGPPEPGPVTAAAETRIAVMIRKFDELSALSDLPDAGLSERFTAITREYVDRTHMARFALGDAAWQLTAEEWDRYLAAYARHLELSFVRGMRKAGASASRVLGSRVAVDGTVLVFTRTLAGGTERDVTWILCRQDPARICDVETGGVTASAHQRSAFAERLRSGGLDDLIRALEAGWLVEIP